MSVDPPTIGLAVRDDDPDRDSDGALDLPAEAPGYFRRQPSFPVDRTHELIEVCDIGLELDDEQGATPWMPGEDVDDSALTVDCKRHLRRRDPVGQLAEALGDPLVQCRMTSIEEPVEIPASPSRNKVNANVEGARDGAKSTDR